MRVCVSHSYSVFMQAEKSIADDEEEKVGIIAEEVSKKQKGWIAVFILHSFIIIHHLTRYTEHA